MKILLLSHSHFKDALTNLGHEVTVRTDDAVERMDVSRSEADLIIVHESLGMRHIPHGIEKSRAPTVFYSVDVHLNLYWHREYAQLFDYVFVTQKDYVSQLNHENAFWLPASIDPAVFKNHHLERIHDIVFVGTIDEQRKKRQNIIRELQKRFDVKVFGTDPGCRLSHNEMAKIYSQAKIVLNESILREVTFRTFEAIACGSMLLTEKVDNGLFDLFEDASEIVAYDYHDFIEKAGYYLHNDEERIRIAEKGKNKVLSHHTVHKSAEAMLAVLGKHNFKKRNAAQNRAMLHYGKALYFTGIKFPRHKVRRLRRAESILGKLIVQYPEDYEPALYLAFAYAAKDNFAQALEVLRTYAGRGAWNFFVASALACLELREGNSENALKYYNEITQKSFSAAHDFYFNLAAEYEKKGFLFAAGFLHSDAIPIHAVDCYLQAQSCEGMLAAALLYYKLELFESACALLEPVKNAIPHDRAIKYLLGLSYLRMYAIHSAVDEFKDILSLDEADGVELLSRAEKNLIKGEICMKQLSFAPAAAYFLQADCDEAYMRAGYAYLKMDDFKNALAAFKKACEKRRFDPEAHAFLGIACLKLGLAEIAQKEFEKSLELKEDEEVRKLLNSLCEEQSVEQRI